MTRAIILALALTLCACADDPKVVTRTEVVLPAPPSPDLLVEPAPTVTAGSKNVGEALERLATDNKRLRMSVLGWQLWWRDAQRSVEAHKAPK